MLAAVVVEEQMVMMWKLLVSANPTLSCLWQDKDDGAPEFWTAERRGKRSILLLI